MNSSSNKNKEITLNSNKTKCNKKKDKNNKYNQTWKNNFFKGKSRNNNQILFPKN